MSDMRCKYCGYTLDGQDEDGDWFYRDEDLRVWDCEDSEEEDGMHRPIPPAPVYHTPYGMVHGGETHMLDSEIAERISRGECCPVCGEEWQKFGDNSSLSHKHDCGWSNRSRE